MYSQLPRPLFHWILLLLCLLLARIKGRSDSGGGGGGGGDVVPEGDVWDYVGAGGQHDPDQGLPTLCLSSTLTPDLVWQPLQQIESRNDYIIFEKINIHLFLSFEILTSFGLSYSYFNSIIGSKVFIYICAAELYSLRIYIFICIFLMLSYFW